MDPNFSFKEHVRLLDRMGPPKKRRSEEWGDITMGQCACDKKVELALFQVLKTTLVTVVDNVCPGCRHGVRGMAVIACPRCRAVVARIPAHKDPSGFEFKAEHIYHVDCCAVCEHELIAVKQEPTFILEMLHYFKQRGLLIPDQWKNRTYGKPLLLGAG